MPGSIGSFPTQLTAVSSQLFFTADTNTGRELWKSNGTSAGTVLVRDILPGGESSNPFNLINANGLVYFSAVSSSGRELWRSNGTLTGTIQIRDIRAGNVGSYPDGLTAVGSGVFFIATDDVNGREVWRTNGSSAGTIMVRDIEPGVGTSYPMLAVGGGGIVGNSFMFTAGPADGGRRLWTTTGGSTAILPGIGEPTADGILPAERDRLVNVNGTLFFNARSSAGTVQLWKSDGSTAGTVLVRDFGSQYAATVSDLTNVNGTLYFVGTDPVHGVELWKSDGTPGGTVLVRDIWPGIGGSFPSQLTPVGDSLYFYARYPAGEVNSGELPVATRSWSKTSIRPL